jgi:general secretion pathway protein B
MSLILDALNRADQERNEQSQNLSLHCASTTLTPSNRPARRWLVEAIVIIAAIAATYFFAQRETTQPPSNESVATRQQSSDQQNSSEQSSGQQNNSQHSSSQATPGPAKPAENKPPAVEKIAKEPTIKPIIQTQTATDKPINASKEESNSAVSSLYQQQAQAAKKQNQVQKKSPSKPKPTKATSNIKRSPSAEKADSALSIFEQMPLLAQLPNRIKQKVPSIDYSVHVFSDTQTGGLVTLNGKRRRTGDEIAPGLVVIKILQNSVVLDYKGTQFRLLALSSWGNLN